MKDTALVIHLLPLAKPLRNDDFSLQLRQTNTHITSMLKIQSGLAVQFLTFHNTAFFSWSQVKIRESCKHCENWKVLIFVTRNNRKPDFMGRTNVTRFATETFGTLFQCLSSLKLKTFSCMSNCMATCAHCCCPFSAHLSLSLTLLQPHSGSGRCC